MAAAIGQDTAPKKRKGGRKYTSPHEYLKKRKIEGISLIEQDEEPPMLLCAICPRSNAYCTSISGDWKSRIVQHCNSDNHQTAVRAKTIAPEQRTILSMLSSSPSTTSSGPLVYSQAHFQRELLTAIFESVRFLLCLFIRYYNYLSHSIYNFLELIFVGFYREYFSDTLISVPGSASALVSFL